MSKKVAIVVGHTRLRPGAKGIELPAEYWYNSKVANYLKDIADVYHYDSYNYGYISMVKRMARRLNRKSYKLILELHYNSANRSANGCEVFYYFSNIYGKNLAFKLSKKISQTFNVKNRGGKAMVNKKQRGFWALFYPRATTLLVEPFFGSNSNDVGKFKGKQDEYAFLIREFLIENNLI